MSKFRESDQIIFSLKVPARVMDINLVKIVINGVNLVKIGHFNRKIIPGGLYG